MLAGKTVFDYKTKAEAIADAGLTLPLEIYDEEQVIIDKNGRLVCDLSDVAKDVYDNIAPLIVNLINQKEK